MKKRIFGRKLSRDSGSRRALFRSLIKALVENGKITTTKAKAKAVKGQIEKLVNLAKNKKVSSIRSVYAYLGNDRKTRDILFNEIAPSFTSRIGGYVRTVNLPRRKGDLSPLARLEWSQDIIQKEEKKTKGKNTKETTIRKNKQSKSLKK